MAGECSADQLLGGRYALVDELGRGASGVVWRARDQLLQRDVAVKEIRFPLVLGEAEDVALREAILREARAAARLNHSGAVTVYDVVEDEGRPLIVMELVDGPTLAERVASDGPLPPDEVAAIGGELLDALVAGHAAGIVHRDVKPRNVMVEPSGRVRLADFGVAAVIDDARMTSGNVVVGSPAYMAPEQVTGGDVGPAADIWSLGATLYFAVEGRPPFDKGSAIPTMTAIVLEPPRPPERAGALGPLLAALLTKDPAARPTAPFLRLWMGNLAGGVATARSNGRDATSRFAVLPGREVEDIEVPGPQQPPGGPLVPAPISPGGPDVVVIPKGTPSEVPPPAPGPTAPVPVPVPEPSPPPPAPTEPGPEPEPPERVPPPPEPTRVPPPPEADPMRVPPEPDPLVVPAEADGRRGRPRRGPWIAAAGLVVVVVVASVLLATRGDGGGTTARSPDGSGQQPSVSAAVPADWVPYTDPTTGYTISRPPGWSVVVDGSLTDFRDPATGAYLRIDHVRPPVPSPEGAWLELEPRFAAENPGYRRIRIAPATYEGFPAAIWEYTYGGGMRAVDLGFVTGSYGFALNFQAPEADWDRLQPVFEAFKSAFRPPSS